MKNIFKYIIVSVSLVSLSACEKDWLDRDPPNIIVDEQQIWNDTRMITSLLANFYDRLPVHTQLNVGSSATQPTGWQDFAAYDEAIWSGNDDARNNIVSYAFNRWKMCDYALIRDINL